VVIGYLIHCSIFGWRTTLLLKAVIGFPRACLRFFERRHGSFNMLVPGRRHATGLISYSGVFAAMAACPGSKYPPPLSAPSNDFGCIRPASIPGHGNARVHCGQETALVCYKRRHARSTLTKAQFNAGKRPERGAAVPRALFSHSDQIEQWQTAVRRQCHN